MNVREAIKELGNLCKKASALERKWDKAGGEFLGTRLQEKEYAEVVEEYLESVRKLETALVSHLSAIKSELEHGKVLEFRAQKPDPGNQLCD